MAWLRDRRRAEPVSPASVLVVVVLLVIIILGIGGGLPRLLGREEATGSPVGILTPAGPLPLPTSVDSTPLPTPSASETRDTTPPPVMLQPNPSATASANDVVGRWAKQFYTRTPGTRTYADFVEDAAQYMTSDLVTSFIAQGDSTYEALKAQKGSSRVFSATVGAPKPNSAPVDTAGRISRFVTVVVDITGSKPGRITVPLLVTVVAQGNGWVISDVDGGTGP
ncbi:hypothetical protein [Kribbella sp. NPDC048928]|uniref:hypothetical protein n=1 Tax=Kribbella sp. NPDC048928 TaxID=3364111 RepID=UPI00371C332A